jgi:hypothetical protein
MGQAERPRRAGANKSIRRGGHFNASTNYVATASLIRTTDQARGKRDDGLADRTREMISFDSTVPRFNDSTIHATKAFTSVERPSPPIVVAATVSGANLKSLSPSASAPLELD